MITKEKYKGAEGFLKLCMKNGDAYQSQIEDLEGIYKWYDHCIGHSIDELRALADYIEYKEQS
tara:strand:+ start:253 stop:441 length:189 start_codon:yes stop_codon:yes gene_type:complete